MEAIERTDMEEEEIFSKKKRFGRKFLRDKLDKGTVVDLFFFKKNFNIFLKKNGFFKNSVGIESVLVLFLFRLNFFVNLKVAYRFIKNFGVFIDGRLFFNPYFFLSEGQIVNFKKKFFFFFIDYLKNRLKKSKVLLNIPDYILADYKTFSFTIGRKPFNSEIILPYDFPFINMYSSK